MAVLKVVPRSCASSLGSRLPKVHASLSPRFPQLFNDSHNQTFAFQGTSAHSTPDQATTRVHLKIPLVLLSSSL